MKRFLTVKCPKCGYEYLPAEIFYPDNILGKPKDIIRDSNGKIVYFTNDSVSLDETFECYNCDCTFNIFGKLELSSSVDEIHDFSDDYTLDLKESDDIELSVDNELWG